MKFREYQDDFISSKFGIETKVSTNNKRYKHCSFTVYVDGEITSIQSSLSDGRGKKIGKLDFFENKYHMDDLEGIELFDAIENTINQFMNGAISYVVQLLNHNKLEPVEIAGIKKISWLLSFVSKKMDIPFTYPLNLKSKKAIKEAILHIHSVLLLITSANKYDNMFAISRHMVKPYSDDKFGFYKNNVFIDAESYFSGGYDEAKTASLGKLNSAVARAEAKGKSLLIGLAQGDVAINDFDVKS